MGKSNMTERDKKLLTFMFVIVIVVGIGYWGILPQLSTYRELADQIEDEEATQKINKQKLLNLGFLQGAVDDYTKKIAERKEEFYQIMSSSEVDRMMTEIADGENLVIYDLSFSIPTSPTARLAYKNSALYVRQQEQIAAYRKALSDDGTEDSTEEGEAGVMDDILVEEGGYHPNTDIYAVPITITVGGELADLESFKQKILDLEKAHLLVSYSWGEYREIIWRDADGNIISTTENPSGIAVGTDVTTVDGGTTAEVVTRKSLTMRLELYMCDTASINTDTEEAGEETTEEASAEE